MPPDDRRTTGRDGSRPAGSSACDIGAPGRAIWRWRLPGQRQTPLRVPTGLATTRLVIIWKRAGRRASRRDAAAFDPLVTAMR
jgi:anti-sigma factor ChrR (cupin superfamily)